MQLRTESFHAPGHTPTEAVAFLHGILGSGANLRSVARRLLQARPRFHAVLVDLRAHGGSQGEEGPDTVPQAAQDVADTLAGQPLPLTAVVGHSFGGKVALALAGRVPTLQHVVSLDSGPGPRPDARGSEATVAVLRMLRTLANRFPNREAFIAAVEASGQSRHLAQWLAMSVRPDGEGVAFGLHLPRIEALLDSYFAQDAWPVLEASARGEGPAVHLVVGGKSAVWNLPALERARALAAGGRLTLDVLPAAGHWLHVDDFEGLLKALSSRLP